MSLPLRTNWGPRLATLGAIIAVLWLGREILAPLALALLLTLAASPVAAWLERRRVPRVLAVLTVLLLVVGLMGGLLYVVLGQALALAGDLPHYETTLRGKLVAISESGGPIEDLLGMAGRLSDALRPAAAGTGTTIAVAAAGESPLGALFGLLHLVLAPLATAAITLLLMAFLLSGRDDMRDRVLRLVGTNELHRTTRTMLDATDRVGRFLLMQLAMNTAFGLAMGGGLWLLGLPNAPLWGVLGFALRFIPYLGAPLSVLFPLVIAFATTEGWWLVLMVIALFLVVDVAITYVIEPMLYGHSIGVTPLALILATAFWAVLWGPIGLVMAPAMTACIVILGRNVPGFAFLDVLLGDGVPLEPEARFYQRLLAGDAEGAGAILDLEAAQEGAEGELTPALRRLALPAIAQVEADRNAEGYGPALALRAARTLLRVMEDRNETGEEATITLLPVAGALDHAAAATVAALLTEAGHTVAVSMRPAALAVLVLASAAPRQRAGRVLAQARRLAPRVVVLAVTPEGTKSALDAGLTPSLDGLDALIEAAAPLLAEAPQAAVAA